MKAPVRLYIRMFIILMGVLFLCGCDNIFPNTAEALDNKNAMHATIENDPTEGLIETPASKPKPTPATKPTATPTPKPTAQPTAVPTLSSAPEPTKAPMTEASDIISPYPAPEKYGSPYNSDGSLSNKKLSWYFNRTNTYNPPTAQRDFDIRPLGGHYLGDITRKVIYLTFDEGYEYGFTPAILDVLKEKEVTAAFFMTKYFISSQPDLAKRISEEGHIAANHSVSHKSSPDLSDDEFIFELEETARFFKETTGYEMDKFFRPPMGEYSARTLNTAQSIGYQTIFWSGAHVDWDVNAQPTIQYTIDMVLNHMHPGEIILLHAVSKSNTEALADIIDAIRDRGYTFGSLNELPNACSPEVIDKNIKPIN